MSACDSRGESLADRLRRTFLLIGTLVTVAFVATLGSFALSWFWLIPQVDQCRQAKAAASDLNAAVLDEETGLRGYLLTRDPQFLEQVHRGELAIARANEALDRYAAPTGEFSIGLVRTRTAEERWRERWAKPAMESPSESAPRAREGKALFDAYWTEQSALASTISERAERLALRERASVAARVLFELVLFVALLVLALRQHGALRAAIIAPVAALLRDIGRVRDGELITTVNQSGPSELRQLGEGLNDMVRALALARDVAHSRDELVREHANRLRQILDASREFSESLNLSYVVESVRSSTIAVGGYSEVVVWLMNDDQNGLRAASAASATPPHGESNSAVAWRAAKSGRITFEGVDGRVRFGEASTTPLRAIAIPLVVGARVVGALEARHVEARTSTGEAFEVLEMLAAHAATAIESARLNQIAEEHSQMDPLTRLHNRRRLDEDLDAECKRCLRYGRPLAFVMLDVDHFKSFNDTHGHPQGDTALQEVAEVIAGAVRSTDSAYRYGGEEFCVLLRETDGESAMAFAERLRQRVELRFAKGSVPRITASFGVSQFSGDTATPRALVDAADAAMYESKHAGRNRVVLSNKPPLHSRSREVSDPAA